MQKRENWRLPAWPSPYDRRTRDSQRQQNMRVMGSVVGLVALVVVGGFAVLGQGGQSADAAGFPFQIVAGGGTASTGSGKDETPGTHNATPQGTTGGGTAGGDTAGGGTAGGGTAGGGAAGGGAAGGGTAGGGTAGGNAASAGSASMGSASVGMAASMAVTTMSAVASTPVPGQGSPQENVHDSGVAVVQANGQARGGANQNCTLIVPSQPLTATGLATPYRLVATQPRNGPCHEANLNQAAFVQAAIVSTANGKTSISVYDPLVLDARAKPAKAPAVPTLPAGSVVALWFGFNGQVLQLSGVGSALADGACVNGLRGSPFGQVAYCNASAFFSAANAAISAGTLTVPAQGTGKDGQACPTVRDFSVVDMDQSDNVTTAYLINQDGRLAQNTKANVAALPQARLLTNGSDNGLVVRSLDGALGCTPWLVPDLADPGQMTTALPLDELQAAAHQANPALVPSRDPMVLVNDSPNLSKQNLYRTGVDQTTESTEIAANQDQRTYCQQMVAVAPTRLALDAQYTRQATSPMPVVANNLFTFLAQRLGTALGPQGLNCTGILGVRNPVNVRTNGRGVVVDAAFVPAAPITTRADAMPTPKTQDTTTRTGSTTGTQMTPSTETHTGTNAGTATEPTPATSTAGLPSTPTRMPEPTHVPAPTSAATSVPTQAPTATSEPTSAPTATSVPSAPATVPPGSTSGDPSPTASPAPSSSQMP